jgi:hypothetical protein
MPARQPALALSAYLIWEKAGVISCRKDAS